jgi:gamma-glutamylcyclotransferase
MDSHFEQVMQKRAAAGAGTKLYFAYSTILDRAAFLEWRAQHGYEFFDLPRGAVAAAQDVRLVFDFPSRFWGGRVAGLEDASGHSVHGKLFEIPEKDWPIVQHKEGGLTGMCVEKVVKVAGREAIAFATNPARKSSDGPISARFVEALVRGAKSAQLPEQWIAEVEAIRRSAVPK